MSDKRSALDGRYRLEEKLASGGSGTVYRGVQVSSGKKVALKQIKKTEEKSRALDMICKLQHPGLVSVLEIRELETELWMVMDFVEGQDLKTVLSQKMKHTGTALSVRDVLMFTDRLCEVLDYLHTQPVPLIYGDLKPANIMVREDGRIILVDPDSIRPAGNSSDSEKAGTPGYAAPEQYKDEGLLSPQADIYSLGITICQLLTGKDPAGISFQDQKTDLLVSLISSVQNRKEQKKLLGLCRILPRCITFLPENRYRSIAELKKDIQYPERIAFPVVLQKKLLNPGISVILVLSFLAALFAIRSDMEYRNLAERGADYCVEQALEHAGQGQTVPEEGKSAEWWLTSALHLSPGRGDIFQLLLTEMLDDGSFSIEEQLRIRKLLDTVETGFRRTQEDLLLSDPEQYEDFAYRMGIALYFNGEGNSVYQAAGKWFARVRISKRKEQAALFQSLCRIRQEMAVIPADEQNEQKVKSNWADYYHTICSLLQAEKNIEDDSKEPGQSEDETEQLAEASTEYGLCRELLKMFMERTAELAEAGITEKEQMDVTKEIQRKHPSLGETAEAVIKKLSLMEMTGSGEQRR